MQEFMLAVQAMHDSKTAKKVLYYINVIMNIIMFSITGLFLYLAYTGKIYIKQYYCVRLWIEKFPSPTIIM